MFAPYQIQNEPKVRINYGLRRQIELIEAEAWHDLYASASPSLREKLGIKLISLGNIKAAIIPAVDVIALNRMIGGGLLRPLTRPFLEVLKCYLQATGVNRFFLQLHPEAVPVNVHSLLEESSFRYYNKWVKFYRNNSIVLNPVKQIRIITAGEKEKFVFSETLLRSFDWPDILNDWIAGTTGRNNWTHYLAIDGNKTAGTGMTYINGKFAWIGFASTLPEFRGRGIQQAMLTRRIEDCIKSGVKIMVIETAEDLPGKPSVSNRNVKKAGFNIAYERSNFLYLAGN